MSSFVNKKVALIMSVVVTLCLVVALCVVFLYNPTNPATTLEQVSNDNTVQSSTGVASGDVLTVDVTGGSYDTSTDGTNTIYTATPSSGYRFAYWQDGSGIKFSADLSVTTTRANCVPVFIQESAVVEVSDQAELLNAFTTNNSASAMIVLTNDIKVDSSFTMVASFAGTLDGAGYGIDGLVRSGSDNVGGICGTLTGVIKNLEIRGTVSGTGNVGAFAGTLNGGLLSRCSNFATVNAGNSGTAGGMVATATGNTRSCSIYYCANYGSIIGNNVGAVIFTNGTSDSPICNLIQNTNEGALQTTNATA